MTTSLTPQPEDSTEPAVPDLPLATRGGERQSRKEQVALALFIMVPFVALLAAIPVAWGGWFGWSDAAIMVAMYFITTLGVTVG